MTSSELISKKDDSVGNYKNTGGLYPWFFEDGEHLIFPGDLENFKRLLPYGKVFNCIDDVNGYLTLQYGKNTFRVKPNLYKVVNKPRFGIGCKVMLAKDNTQEGTVEENKLASEK